MLVTFVSSETGEVLMFAETAKTLLDLIGKETTRRGTFTPADMLPAAGKLREAVREALANAPVEDEEEEEKNRKKPLPVGLHQRAWPLIDMLERTAKSGPDAYVMWEAKADF